MATIHSDEMNSSRRAFDPSNGSRAALWHGSAPSTIRRAFHSGDASEGWAAWTRHLAKRKEPVAPRRLLPGESPPLEWALADDVKDLPTVALLERIDRYQSLQHPEDRELEGELLGWLAEAAGGAAGVGYAIEALAWCQLLPRSAAAVSPRVWWTLLEHLVAAVGEGGQIDLDGEPLTHQLLAGELGLTLAYLFPEIAPCRKLARGARRELSAGLIELLDGEGLPHAEHLGLMRPLLACWTRCRALEDGLKKGCFTPAARNQYEWLVLQALRLARHDGTHVFSRGSAGAWCGELFTAALRFAGDEDDRDIAALVLPGGKKARAGQVDKSALPSAAIHSEWASTAVLRAGWSRAGARLTVLYPQRSVRMELECKRDVLWSGTWEFEVRYGGQPAQARSDWEEICWVSDEDVDYLELEIDLRGGLRLQRHILLGREDRFLFLADAVMGEEPSELEYRGWLPLAQDVSFHPATDTHEGFLTRGDRRVLVLPLALPEWRGRGHEGRLAETGRGLELAQGTRGRSLLAPLFLDLRSPRVDRPFTWRQLTVAESLKIQPRDVAVGYRVMVGKRQWLIYRSLGSKANRTLLGHNLSTEMLVARFTRAGEVEPLVEIE